MDGKKYSNFNDPSFSFPGGAPGAAVDKICESICIPIASPSFNSSLPSSSATAPHCVSLKKASLTKRGYKSFEDWNSNPNHIYIGRDMSHHVMGALGSKWGNPFKPNKSNSLKLCLERYEDHVRRNPDLFNVMELEGKELGCWCKPYPCHGDILIKLFKERQSTNICSSKSNHQDYVPVFTQHGSNEENDIDCGIISDIVECLDCDVQKYDDFTVTLNGNGLLVNSAHIFTPESLLANVPYDSAPLRLNGGGDTSFESQEDLENTEQGNGVSEKLQSFSSSDIEGGDEPPECNENSENIDSVFVNVDNSMSEQDIRDVLFEAGYSIDAINDIITSKAGAKSNESTCSQTLIDESVLSESESGTNSAYDVLREIRVKNVNKVVIGTLNINSFASKFEQLREIIGRTIDILTIQETKLDPSFPLEQFTLEGYFKPYRLDRNRYGGGVLIYVREDIPSKLLNKHNFTKNVEGMFIEINLRKTKLLFFGGYRSDHQVYGLSKEDYLDQIIFAMDKYSNYDKVLIAGDLNIDVEEDILEDFLFEQNMKNLVKEKTCFKSMENPSCIDLFLTNVSQSFQNTTTIATGLSDFHKMVVTVMKTTFPKAQPKIVYYRDYKNFDLYKFRSDLREQLCKTAEKDYFHFELTFLRVLELHAPMKKKVLRANDKPYMTKVLRKAIMRRSELKGKYLKNKSEESLKAFKRQKNYTNRLAKRERRKYFANLDLNKYIDNVKFWNTVKPMFSSTGNGPKKIILVENGEVVADDQINAESFSDFFIDAVSSLAIEENRALLDEVDDLSDPVQRAVIKFGNHPSILDIKKNVTITSKFSFCEVDVKDMMNEINNLNSKKSGTFMNIPVKRLKEVVDIVAHPLTDIWKREIVLGKKFASQLKLAISGQQLDLMNSKTITSMRK